jgi:hypothetical protein
MSELQIAVPFEQGWRSCKVAPLMRILAAGVAFVCSSAQAEPVVVKNFDIFVDPPTAFVFVKMPQGWKFVGKLDEDAMRELPPSVHTSLLPARPKAQLEPQTPPKGH